MKRSVALGLAVVLLSAEAVCAQVPRTRPNARPTISPYLNLFRQGGSLEGNYYGLVRPEFRAYNSIQQLQHQQTTLGARQQELESSSGALPATGHATGFLTHHKYFLSQGRGSGAGNQATGASPQIHSGKSSKSHHSSGR